MFSKVFMEDMTQVMLQGVLNERKLGSRLQNNLGANKEAGEC